MSNGQDFARAVGKFIKDLGLDVEPEYSIAVGIGSKSTKPHRFDFGNSEVLVECKCYGWTQGGNNPSGKISTVNEAMLYFHSTPDTYRKMLYLPRRVRADARNPETFAERYVRLHGHLIPAAVEVWEFDTATSKARRVDR